MDTHLQAADHLALLEVIDPDAYGTVNLESGWVDASRIICFLVTGLIGTASGGHTISMRQATDGSGTGAKAVTGATTGLQTTSDAQYVISVMADSLDVSNGFRYVSIRLQTTGSTDGAVCLFGVPTREQPATDLNIASVGEVVRVV